MSRSASRSRNAGACSGRLGRRRHAVGLSLKTWMAVAPIVDARSTAAATIPSPSGQVGAEAPAVGSMDESYDAGTMPHDTDQPVPRRPRPEPGDRAAAGETLPPEVARVLRSFFRDGRLVSIPAKQRKRRIVLCAILRALLHRGPRVPEKEVNQRLALFHPDVAALRRYLVDDGLMTREAASTAGRSRPGD